MSQIKLLRTRRFWPLFWTQFFGAFNDNFFKNSLVILIAFRSAKVMGISPGQMVPLASGIFILPFFIFSAIAGQLADQQEKSRLVRWVKIFEIAIMIFSAWGFITHHYGFLLWTLFLMGTHSAFFGPIKYSILPQILAPDELVEGNALIEAGTFLAILLGTISGGVLIGWGDRGPLMVGFGLIGVAILGWVTSRALPVIPAVDPGLRVQWNPVLPTAEIFKSVRRNRPVWVAVVGISWFWFYGAAMLSLFPGYCRETLGTAEGTVTLFLAIFSVGIGVGSLLCGRLSRGKVDLGLVPIGLLGMTTFTFDLFRIGQPRFAIRTLALDSFASASVLSAPPRGVVDFLSHFQGFLIATDLLLLSVFSGLFIVPLYALMQERSERSHVSRVIAANNVLNAFFMVGVSGLLIGFLGVGFAIPQIFGILGGLNLIAGLVLFRSLPEFMSRLKSRFQPD